MARSKPCWFLVPRGFPPGGPIRRGNIVTLPNAVEDPLTKIDASQLVNEEIYNLHERDFSISITNSKCGRYGVYTSFLQTVLGFGVDKYGMWTSSLGKDLKATSMLTSSFLPSQEFIESQISDGPVKQRIIKSRFRLTVYMVVGTMTAYGAKSTSSTSRERGGGVSVGVDATALGVPLGSGPHVEMSKKQDVQIEVGSSDEFVFAYRLRKIVIKRGETGVVKQENYSKGALFDSDAVDHALGAAMEQRYEIAGASMEPVDYVGDDVDEVRETSDANGQENCLYVVPEGFD